MRSIRCRNASAAAGQRPAHIAAALGYSSQAVRDALRAFHERGLACLKARPPIPKQPRAAWPRPRDEELKELLHHSPRLFGQPTSLWTLELAADVSRANFTGALLKKIDVTRAVRTGARGLDEII